MRNNEKLQFVCCLIGLISGNEPINKIIVLASVSLTSEIKSMKKERKKKCIRPQIQSLKLKVNRFDPFYTEWGNNHET